MEFSLKVVVVEEEEVDLDCDSTLAEVEVDMTEKGLEQILEVACCNSAGAWHVPSVVEDIVGKIVAVTAWSWCVEPSQIKSATVSCNKTDDEQIWNIKYVILNLHFDLGEDKSCRNL